MKRLITGFIYLLTLVGFYMLKALTGKDFFFDIPVYAFSLIGTYEMLNAFAFKAQADEEKGVKVNTIITKGQKITVWVYAALFTPLFVLADEFINFGMQSMFVCFIAVVIVLLIVLVCDYKNATLGGTGCAILSCLYPTGLLGFLLLTNHMGVTYSCIAVLFIFITSPCSDCFAYLFGKYLGKFFPKKMAPEISPKKTMIGGLGGLIGGGVGAVILYIAYCAAVPDFVFLGSSKVIEIIAAAVIGIIAAFMTEIGDLAESCIKRKVGIKDMGKLLPGHGGILDRIDGTLFTAAFVYLVFSVISHIV